MIKACGTIMLLFGGIWLGVFASRNLEMRVKTLRSLIECLELFEWELTTNMPPTKQLFQEISKRISEPASLFIRDCIRQMGTCKYSMSEIWEMAAKEHLKALKLEDFEALLPVGAVLGRYDAESQKSSIKAIHDRLAMNLIDSIDEKKRLGRLYSTLGVTAGVFFVIILL